MSFVFCDTEKKPYEQYNDIKRKINDFHGAESVAGEIIIYANPCTMQIILSHWKDVKLIKAAKKVNAHLIEECTGIKNYRAKKDQLEILMEQITKANYQDVTVHTLSETNKRTTSESI